LDSGIRLKPDLNAVSGASRVIAAANFVTTENTTDDLCGHGTHVAGIVAGNAASSTGPNYFRSFYGIARNTNLVNVRVLDSTGTSNVSTVLQGIQWVINNKAQYNIRVMNLSLGHQPGDYYHNDPLCLA